MKLHIHHRTHYTYTEPLRHMVQSLHLWPSSGPWQTVGHWALKSPVVLHGRVDALGNHVHHGSWVASAHRPPVLVLEVEAHGVLTTHGVSRWADAPGLPHPGLFLRSTPTAEPHARMTLWAAQALGLGPLAVADCHLPSPAQVLALAQAVQQKVRYRPGQTHVETTALEAFDWGLGVCQDQAQVMVAVCRGLGWPARYVSGYFYAADEPDLASHAWAEVCLDVARREWMALDITHACETDERHVRLAAGTDYSTCPPIKGLRQGGGEEKMTVNIEISMF